MTPDLFSLDAATDYVLTISDLAVHIKRVIESDPILCDIGVRGEISNFKAHGKGHLYFTLKDEAAMIRCCMWRTNVGRLAFRPTDGNRVMAWGRVEFYGARGEANFIVEELQFDGRGALFEAYERLKMELAAEGLFDTDRKRPLPPMPRRIGLITSPTGAVAHDVLTVLRRRWPLATVVFIPAAVQGFSAVPDLLRALSWAAAVDDLDVLIVARGGGSAEDLWAFNDEDLARAVAAFPKPVISAIGHETDFTILDFVADLRAPTPSAAAEMVAPDIRELQAVVDGLRYRLHSALAGDVRLARQRLNGLLARRALTHPRERLQEWKARVGQLRERAQDATLRRVKIERRTLEAQCAQLRALNPQRVLERGYALVSDAESGSLVTSALLVRPRQRLQVALHDGVIFTTANGQAEAANNAKHDAAAVES